MAVCFIGHRRIEEKEVVFERVKEAAERLIVEKNIKVFHFGSRSKFDDICHAAVTELQKAYPDIIRVNYNCKGEYVVKKEEREELERIERAVCKKEVRLNDFEQGKISDRVYYAGKASYVQRNQEMIDDSEYCVFFYCGGYTPNGKNPRATSGTRLAYEYASRKNKIIINIADEISKNES